MSIRAELQASVAAAFDSDLSDAVKTFNLKKLTSTTYDSATGENVNVYLEEPTRGVFESFTHHELYNTNIKPTDIKVLILQNELSVEPAIDDFLVTLTNTFKVISYTRDAADVTWVLQCRL